MYHKWKEKFLYFCQYKRIYIFGAGIKGKACLHILQRKNISVEAFWDNDSSKYGNKVGNICIEKPKLVSDAIIIIAVYNSYFQLHQQLMEMGFHEDNIFFFDELQILEIEDEIREAEKTEICEYPSTIQLPITYLCNFDCIMCGMKQLTGQKEFYAEELEKILQDSLFSKVESVGVNGGEPFLKNDMVECIEVMIDNLPSLKNFYIISNGFYTEKILSILKKIKKKCRYNRINVYLSISIDGVHDLQDFHRGHKDAFINAEETIKKIKEKKEDYVDSINAICTITRYNIRRINEVVAWAEDIGIEVEYNLATVNERIRNCDKEEGFSVFSDVKSRMLASEFFYCQYQKTKKEKYYALYLFMKYKKRYAICPYQYNAWITVFPNAQIGFCATHSRELGSALHTSAYSLVKENIDYLDEIKKRFCSECSHYIDGLSGEGKKLLFEENMRNRMLG